ncbi:MAG: hypothetical protein HZA31_09335 [Opitutae bacterium]|nr:hypothetical protein [Opitutae bacterium]
MPEPESAFIPDRKTTIAATVAIAATCLYSSLFVESALFEIARASNDRQNALRLILIAAGGSGVVGCLAAARRFELARFPKALGTAFRASGVVAALGYMADSWWVLLTTAIAAGLCLGWLAVTLTAGLRATLGTVRLGRILGFGVGAGYALCSLAWGADASPRTQILLAGASAVFGALAAPWLWPREITPSPAPDYTPRTATLWVAMLLPLVAIDTATLDLSRQIPTLHNALWHGSWNLLGNTCVFFAAAYLAGRALERGWLGRTCAAACILVTLAALKLDRSLPEFLSMQVVFVAGVATYSTAALYYVARGGHPVLTGWLFAVAGVGGTALGVVVAQELGEMPLALLAIALALVALGIGLRAHWRARILGAMATALVFGLVVQGAGLPDTAKLPCRKATAHA